MGNSSQSLLARLGGLTGAILLSSSIYAGEIQVENASARATAPGQDSAMLDLTITSKQAATLVGISSAASKNVELHSMTHENGVMKMREVKTLELPAGKRINLGEHGYHLMLTGLNAPLKAGETVTVTLTVRMTGQHTEKVEVKAEVKPLTAGRTVTQEGERAHHHH